MRATTATPTRNTKPEPRSRTDLYQMVTDRIIEALEADFIPWQKPWVGGGAPRNLITGRKYGGVNAFLLGITAEFKGYTHPYWLTFNQVKEAGGQVRAGERATAVVFWRVTEHEVTDPKTGEPLKNPETGEVEKDRRFILRYYNVFNVAQTDGLAHLIPQRPQANEGHVETAEAIWAGYRNRPSLAFGGSRAFYMKGADAIQLPPRDLFTSTEAYYATLFHEAVHSTGHPSRLNRATLTQATWFGDANYSQEELVAEIGAAMLLAEAGIEQGIPNRAAYVRGWLQALRDDRRIILVAAQQAEKAVRHILGNTGADDANAQGEHAPAAGAEA